MKPVDSASTDKNHILLYIKPPISTKTACMLSSYQEIGGLMEINQSSDNNNTQPPQPKKQTRRRLQTNKPYQQRLLNMAEARREIATALKFHRASMKQQQTASNHPATATATATASDWPMPPIAPPPPLVNQENLNVVLPTQTLGLNLNFKDFNNLSTSVYYNPRATSSAPSAAKEVAVVGSAPWCETMDTNEDGAEVGKKAVNSNEDDGYYHCFEQVMELPPWLINANENSSFQHVFDHHFSDEYSPDPALPGMDIGEIEGMDGEWLA